MQYVPQIGDILYRPKLNGFIEHQGIVVGPDLVLDNTPEAGERVGSIAKFSAGKRIRVQRTNAHRSDIIVRAQKVLLQRRSYNLAFRNCQHTVSEVVTGTAKSVTVAMLCVCIALLVLFAFTRRGN